MSNMNLTHQFIANTYHQLLQREPDTNIPDHYYNGLGITVSVINRDDIGTVKMFYPVGGAITPYFDMTTGLGHPTTNWWGWSLCNGQNGTPDLRGRFVVSVGDGYSLDDTGGTNSISLDATNLPPHHHTVPTSSQGIADHVHTAYGDGLFGNGTIDSGTTGGTGGVAQPIDNRPPYYALCYVMRVS